MTSASSVLTGSYDYSEVARSVLIAIVASYAALDLTGRVTAARGRVRLAWLSGGAIAMGLGIWAMHFKGMLAFHLPVPVEYHWPTVLASVLVAILASAVALYVASRPKMGPAVALTGSIFMAAGVAGMHYIGMAAMRVPAITRYSPLLVTCSISLALLFSPIALLMAFDLREDTRWSVPRRLGSAAVLGVAVSAMHYTGMAAASFIPALPPDLSHAVSISPVGNSGVALVVLILLVVAVTTSSVDRRRSEERLRLVIDTVPAMLHSARPDGYVDFFNKRWLEYMGVSLEDIQGWRWTNVLHPEDVENTVGKWRSSLATGKPFEAEARLRRADGEYRLTLFRKVPLRDEAGSIVKWYGSAIDIEDRKRSEAALRESETRFRLVADSAPVMLWMSGTDKLCTYFNKPWLDFTGRSIDRELGNGWAEGVSPEDLQRCLDMYLQAFDRREAFRMEYRLRRHDREFRWISDIGVPRFNADQSFAGYIGSCIDVTEQRQAEEQMRQSEAYLAEAQKLSHTGSWASNPATGEIRYWSEECYRVLGFDPHGGLPRFETFFQRIHSDDQPRTWEKIERARRETADFEVDYRIVHPGGEIRDIHAVGHPVIRPSGDFVEFVGTVIDISERKHAEEALSASAQQQCQIAEQLEKERARLLEAEEVARMGSWELMFPTMSVIWSRQTHRIFETDPYRFHPSRSTFREFIHQDDRAKVDAAFFASRANHSPCAIEYRIVMPDGRVKILEERWQVFHDEQGEPVRAAGTCRDITERRQEESERRALEQQLRQAQKMEAVGTLAGGIAHDFNNLLMVIQSYTEMLQDSLPVHDPLRKNTQQVMKAADRGASLTRQMLAFSRKQILSPVVLDLNVVIDETAKMLRRLIGEDIEFRVDETDSLWATEADADQMVQVLMNLCVNARDAMPHGGTLTITTGNVTVEQGSVGGQEFVPPGDYVWLSVADTGTGIGKEFQEQVFEPFFTTKEVGKGTGLGLSTVYGIVKQSGGYVWVDSELGHGACFMIYLPRTEKALSLDSPAKVEARSHGAEILLVAEDEEALREVVCDYLSSLGYTVLAAASGKEALSAASQREGKIDLLITDLVMPKMSGRELAQMMGSICANLKTIYMSGYTDDMLLRHDIHDPGVTFLQKPFSLGNLARKVRETLGPIQSLED